MVQSCVTTYHGRVWTGANITLGDHVLFHDHVVVDVERQVHFVWLDNAEIFVPVPTRGIQRVGQYLAWCEWLVERIRLKHVYAHHRRKVSVDGLLVPIARR